MADVSFFKDYKSYISFKPDKMFKTTLFENNHILIGLNCLKPGQEMSKHAHEDQNRFYLVLQGCCHAQVGEEETNATEGIVIWIPSGHTHSVKNSGSEELVLLVGFTPAHEH